MIIGTQMTQIKRIHADFSLEFKKGESTINGTQMTQIFNEDLKREQE
jgi:hypothetical protein